jgi:CBS domain-containing protein
MARQERAAGQGAGIEGRRGAATGSRSRSQRVSREESVRDIMTAEPRALAPGASAMDAAQVMRDNDIGDVVVLEEERLYGIVTDRDIVIRVLAEQSDPSAVRLADICSRDLTTIAPDASVGEAVRLIREKSIRRLPVVEQDGQVVGIVSLGDIAVARDRRSALGDISAAAPNT